MLAWAITFFVIALIAGFFGFFSLAATAGWIAKILFIVFLAVAIASLITGLVRRRRV
jgi:uncharacterized membrane protein YtjA (UPF0391 family)